MYLCIMARILCLDYGLKRCGLAATDPFQIIVNALTTVETQGLKGFLEAYFTEENVEKIVIGKPLHRDGTPTHIMKDIELLVNWLKQKFPGLHVDFQDESFTSVEAREVIMQSGVSRKKRQDKAMIDRVSAVLILQKYLKHI